MTPERMSKIHAAAFTQSRPWSTAEFRDLLANSYTHAIGDDCCFALYQVIAGEAELLTIATHPDHQGQGLARACMHNWQAHARQIGARWALLEVAVDNAAACALYEKCGYVVCGQRKGYYRRDGQPSVDAIVMECDLTRRDAENSDHPVKL